MSREQTAHALTEIGICRHALKVAEANCRQCLVARNVALTAAAIVLAAGVAIGSPNVVAVTVAPVVLAATFDHDLRANRALRNQAAQRIQHFTTELQRRPHHG